MVAWTTKKCVDLLTEALDRGIFAEQYWGIVQWQDFGFWFRLSRFESLYPNSRRLPATEAFFVSGRSAFFDQLAGLFARYWDAHEDIADGLSHRALIFQQKRNAEKRR